MTLIPFGHFNIVMTSLNYQTSSFIPRRLEQMVRLRQKIYDALHDNMLTQTKQAVFYAPESNDRGILLLSCLFVCLSVCLFFCLSVVNINIRYYFLTIRRRDFIFGIHTPLMMPFQMAPRLMTLWP